MTPDALPSGDDVMPVYTPSTEPVVRLEVRLSFFDRLRAGFAALPNQTKSLRFGAVFAALGLCVLVLFPAVMHKPPSWIDWLVGLYLLGFLPIAVASGAWTGYRAARSYGGRFSYEFSEAGLRVFTPKVDRKHAWRGMTRVRERGGFLLVYFGGCAYALPLRDFPDAHALQETRRLARVVGTDQLPA